MSNPTPLSDVEFVGAGACIFRENIARWTRSSNLQLCGFLMPVLRSLTFWQEILVRLWWFTAVVVPTDEEFAVLRFPVCQIVKFGYPNVEALPGHPLYSKGLSYYGLFEALDSSWIKTLAEKNLVSFPNPSPSRPSRRHFVVTFHDSTL